MPGFLQLSPASLPLALPHSCGGKSYIHLSISCFFVCLFVYPQTTLNWFGTWWFYPQTTLNWFGTWWFYLPHQNSKLPFWPTNFCLNQMLPSLLGAQLHISPHAVCRGLWVLVGPAVSLDIVQQTRTAAWTPLHCTLSCFCSVLWSRLHRKTNREAAPEGRPHAPQGCPQGAAAPPALRREPRSG